MEVALEAGAEDIRHEGDKFEVTCPLDAFNTVSNALDAANIPSRPKQLTRISANTVDVTDVEAARTILKLLEQLDDHDDVQSVAANYEMSEEVLAAAST